MFRIVADFPTGCDTASFPVYFAFTLFNTAITVMNLSTNPFLPKTGNPNDSFVLNQIPALTVSLYPTFMQSTPTYTMPKPGEQFTVLVQPPPVVLDRQTLQSFSEFMHQHGEKFLLEFESYLT